MKVSQDGAKLEVVARGFRANNGLGVGPRGELTSIDNQGHWMPGNRINWIKPGGWYGYQWAWNPEGRHDLRRAAVLDAQLRGPLRRHAALGADRPVGAVPRRDHHDLLRHGAHLPAAEGGGRTA